jgi:hypothetical protein
MSSLLPNSDEEESSSEDEGPYRDHDDMMDYFEAKYGWMSQEMRDSISTWHSRRDELRRQNARINEMESRPASPASDDSGPSSNTWVPQGSGFKRRLPTLRLASPDPDAALETEDDEEEPAEDDLPGPGDESDQHKLDHDLNLL